MVEAKALPFLLATYQTSAAHDPGWPFNTTAGRGYGTLLGTKRRVYAHRLAWTLEHGPIPEDMYVCHHCDTPACFWIEHLFLGTPTDNAMDCVMKGRANKVGKLTAEQVAEVRERTAAGGVLQRELAAEYGVSRATIYRALYVLA